MTYDLSELERIAREGALKISFRSADILQIAVRDNVLLDFRNLANDDCGIGFAEGSWHTHDNPYFESALGEYVQLDYLDVMRGLADGTVVVCELWTADKVISRWLSHLKYNDDFRTIGVDEELRVWRADVEK